MDAEDRQRLLEQEDEPSGMAHTMHGSLDLPAMMHNMPQDAVAPERTVTSSSWDAMDLDDSTNDGDWAEQVMSSDWLNMDAW